MAPPKQKPQIKRLTPIASLVRNIGTVKFDVVARTLRAGTQDLECERNFLERGDRSTLVRMGRKSLSARKMCDNVLFEEFS